MTDFLQIEAPLVAFVGFVFIMAGLIPPLREAKAFHFLCGELSFIAAISYAALTVLGVSSFAPYGAALWFVTGSGKFAQATWLENG